MTVATLLALATSTGEAITTAVIAAFFALLSWIGFRRGRRSIGWPYAVVAAVALVLTVMSAFGHVFHGW